MDKIVFDIETKNSFADVGGDANVHKLDASVIGAYSYERDEYFCFEENEFGKFEELARNAKLLVGFCSKRFDIPVLKKYFKLDLAAIPHFDILEEIEKTLGRRIGLGVLAEANLGVGKTGKGLEAIDLYRNGEIQKLKDYCVQDVRITKGVFDLIKTQKYLWIPQKYQVQMTKLPIEHIEEESFQAGLF